MANRIQGAEKGFTLVELLTVVAILSVLAAIAIPNLLQYRRNANDKAAVSDIKNAFTAAQAYFLDYPTASVTLDNVKNAGYQQTDYVHISIVDGNEDTLEMDAQNIKGVAIYSIDARGVISKK